MMIGRDWGAAHMRGAGIAGAMALGLLAQACAVDAGTPVDEQVAPYDDDAETDPELGVSAQALAGMSDFWMPARSENLVYVNYCFTDLQRVINEGTRNLVGDALRASFQKHANIVFDDRGACSAQPLFWAGIRIDPDITHQVNGVAASVPGYSLATTQTPAMWLPLISGKALPFCDVVWQLAAGNGNLAVGERECMKYIVVHEFAHALGFNHESHRGDRPAGAACPLNGVAQSMQGDPPNTLVTSFDPVSTLDWSYCTPINGQPLLSTNDIAGIKAIYGSGSNTAPCPTSGCARVKYSLFAELKPYAIRGQQTKRWLQIASNGVVGSQSFIGEWERVRFEKVGGQPADGLMRYGDVVYVRDVWGRYLNSNPQRAVSTAPHQQEWERWVVSSLDTAKWPNGTPVYVNAPLRLYSQAHGAGRRLALGSTGVYTDPSNQVTELRIQGPLKALDTP